MSFVYTAFNKGLRARASPSDGLLLHDGTRHRVLVDSSGGLTKFGREYEALAGESLPADGYDATQTPSCTGVGRDGRPWSAAGTLPLARSGTHV